MPRYYFDIQDGKRLADETGIELDTHAAAYSRAIEVMANFLQGSEDDAWTGHPWTVCVLDAGRRPLFDLAFTATELGRSAQGSGG